MQIPKVSIIIAVYNNSQYLPAAINSALNQDYGNLDVWVCDDCSTENVMPELPEYTAPNIMPNLIRQDEIELFKYNYATAKKLYYIRLKKNGGPSRARNIAIANAMHSGSHLFQILDSDDIMFPNKVSTLIKPILLNPERIAMSYGDYLIKSGDNYRYESKPAYDYVRFFNGDCHVHSGSLVNGLALQPFMPTPYPEHLRVTEDYYMARKILRSQQWLAYNIAEPLTWVLSHANDSTNSVSKSLWEECYRRTMTET